MALHHAEDKKHVFSEVYHALAPEGVFVFADHMAGTSPLIDTLIAKKRAKIKFGNEILTNYQIERFIREDKEKQEAEGNKCESVHNYIQYLREVGFSDVDCLWRDHWLAVFVARKVG